MSPLVKYELRDRAASLVLDDPGRRNPLSPQLRSDLAAAIERALADDAARVIVISGAGGTFCAGGDLAAPPSDGFGAARARMEGSHRLIRLLARSSKPVIAAVEGWCAGAGLSLACCADTIIAGRSARFVASFVKVGLMADLGLLHLLPPRIGTGRARQMLMYAEPVSADQALASGLVDRTVDDGTTLEAAFEAADRLSRLAPLALACTRQALAPGLEAFLDWERDVQAGLLLSKDHQEGKAAFFEKRAAAFSGR